MLLDLYLTIFEQSTILRMALKRVYPLQSSIFDAGRLLSCLSNVTTRHVGSEAKGQGFVLEICIQLTFSFLVLTLKIPLNHRYCKIHSSLSRD